MSGDVGFPQKLLVAIASYGTNNDSYLARLIEEYQAMPLSVRIVVLSNLQKPVPAGVELIVGMPTEDPWSLPFAHKKVLAEGINNHDLFIYSEDDTLIKYRHIEAFLRVSASLPENEIPGFFRYEEYGNRQKNYAELHGHFHWDAASVVKRGDYVFAYLTNEHSACYLLTQRQLRKAMDSGGFLVPPHKGKYDLACTASTDPYTQCGFRRIVCISHFDDFLIQHLPNKYVGTRFGINEEELRTQLAALLRINSNRDRAESLFETETRLPDAKYSKDYYEPVSPDVVAAIPKNAHAILSIGCGAGTLETSLIHAGKRVTAVPIDPAISARAASEGVEMVYGDFGTAREQLSGRQFDCVIFSNVLHLVPDPKLIVSSFGNLLSNGGVAVVRVPNLARFPELWKKLSGVPHFQDLGNYGKSGTHFTSFSGVNNWFKSAGLKPGKIVGVFSSSERKASRLTLGMVDRFLASELIAIGKKI